MFPSVRGRDRDRDRSLDLNKTRDREANEKRYSDHDNDRDRGRIRGDDNWSTTRNRSKEFSERNGGEKSQHRRNFSSTAASAYMSPIS